MGQGKRKLGIRRCTEYGKRLAVEAADAIEKEKLGKKVRELEKNRNKKVFYVVMQWNY